MKKKLNILFIASWYPNKDLSFNGDFVQRHAQAVSLFGNVTVIHVASSKQKEKFIVEDVVKENVREIRVYHKKIDARFFLIRSLKNLLIKHKAYKIAMQKVQKPDIVHLHIIYPGGLFALYLKKKNKIPYIITEHWSKFLSESPEQFNFIELFLIKLIARHAKMICPVAESLKNAMMKAGLTGNFQIIPNVVNTRLFFLEKINNIEKTIRFLHISGMDDHIKNITGILNAVKIASLKHPNFKLTFVGCSDIDQYLHHIKKLNIPEQIINFKGVVPYYEVANIMQQHDALLMFSNFESLPCVISEALVCGLPVISSNVGGIPEMINKENGILVEKQNEQELAQAMLYMMENYNRFDKEQIARMAKQKYSYEVVGKQYYELYLKVLEK